MTPEKVFLHTEFQISVPFDQIDRGPVRKGLETNESNSRLSPTPLILY